MARFVYSIVESPGSSQGKRPWRKIAVGSIMLAGASMSGMILGFYCYAIWPWSQPVDDSAAVSKMFWMAFGAILFGLTHFCLTLFRNNISAVASRILVLSGFAAWALVASYGWARYQVALSDWRERVGTPDQPQLIAIPAGLSSYQTYLEVLNSIQASKSTGSPVLGLDRDQIVLRLIAATRLPFTSNPLPHSPSAKSQLASIRPLLDVLEADALAQRERGNIPAAIDSSLAMLRLRKQFPLGADEVFGRSNRRRNLDIDILLDLIKSSNIDRRSIDVELVNCRLDHWAVDCCASLMQAELSELSSGEDLSEIAFGIHWIRKAWVLEAGNDKLGAIRSLRLGTAYSARNWVDARLFPASHFCSDTSEKIEFIYYWFRVRQSRILELFLSNRIEWHRDRFGRYPNDLNDLDIPSSMRDFDQGFQHYFEEFQKGLSGRQLIQNIEPNNCDIAITYCGSDGRNNEHCENEPQKNREEN